MKALTPAAGVSVPLLCGMACLLLAAWFLAAWSPQVGAGLVLWLQRLPREQLLCLSFGVVASSVLVNALNIGFMIAEARRRRAARAGGCP